MKPPRWWGEFAAKRKVVAAARAYKAGNRATFLWANGYKDTLAHGRARLDTQMQLAWVEVWRALGGVTGAGGGIPPAYPIVKGEAYRSKLSPRHINRRRGR